MVFTQVVLLATIVASVAAAPYSYLESRHVSAYELAERDLNYEFESRDLEARRYTRVKINVLGTASSSTIKEAHKIMKKEWKASKGLQEFDTCDVTEVLWLFTSRGERVKRFWQPTIKQKTGYNVFGIDTAPSQTDKEHPSRRDKVFSATITHYSSKLETKGTLAYHESR
ncbi:hypothetical protein C8J56DRAFT_1072516 [Mycena floridula]|nr:hypothetical protein C8J56DRAFT_1072516 [Mycena floridula]